MSQMITDTFTAPRRFSQCRSWYIILTVRFLEKRSFRLFWEGFLSWAEGALTKSQKALFPPKQTYKKWPLCHSQNPLVIHENPWRLVTVSKCGFRAWCPKTDPAARPWPSNSWTGGQIRTQRRRGMCGWWGRKPGSAWCSNTKTLSGCSARIKTKTFTTWSWRSSQGVLLGIHQL